MIHNKIYNSNTGDPHLAMKRQRENSVADCIERVEREDIHQMDEFKSGLVPGMPPCIDNLVLDYELDEYWNCSICDGSYNRDLRDDDDYPAYRCRSCGLKLCADCALGDGHDEPWMFCEECCQNICGRCLHKCECDAPTPSYGHNCNGCTVVYDRQI